MVDVNFIATNKFFHTDSVTGEVRSWQQEDEGAVATREEAVAVIQRTIDFWLPKLRDDLHISNGMALSDAATKAKKAFAQNINETLRSPFPKKFGLTFDDFTFYLP